MWIISLVITSSSLSGLDCNEEQDVGHEFKRPVVCWPASWQGNECLSDENAHTHSQSLMQSDSELAVSCYYVVWKCWWTGESQERWMFYVVAKTRRYIFNALCHFPNHCAALIQNWLQYMWFEMRVVRATVVSLPCLVCTQCIDLVRGCCGEELSAPRVLTLLVS